MGAEIAGRYRVEKLLSRQGATSLIYLASDRAQQGKTVVLKCARVARKDRHLFQDHLRQEVEVLQKLSHPGVVCLYPALDGRYVARADTLSGAPWYYVMEYLPGGSLTHWLSLITRDYPLEWRLRIFSEIVEVVACLHKQGYGHGDLKLDHILFRSAPAIELLPQPVLIDFGSASRLGETSGDQTASIPYAAPELLHALEGKTVHPFTPSQEVWALGAMLFEIITGQRLVPGTSHRVMRNNVLRGRFNWRNVALPSSIQSLLTNMLQASPENRCSLPDLQRELQYTLETRKTDNTFSALS